MRRLRTLIAGVAFIVAGIAGARGQATPGMTSAAIQAAINSNTTATFTFAAGTYTLASSLTLPCSSGVLYTGPNVGVVTQSNLPTAILPANYTTLEFVFYTSNGTPNSGYVPGVSGCAIQYFEFSGTGGGIYIHYPSYGVNIDSNAFTGNNPPVPAPQHPSEANIWVDGSTTSFTAATGANYINVTNNVSFGNCAAIQAASSPTDEGGYCSLTMVSGWTNYFTFSNNTVNGTEQGLKWVERSSTTPIANNDTVTNNNISNYSRIGFEAQQITNGSVLVAHNAVYQPMEPGNLTFALSLPASTGCTAPCWTVQDNAMINGVPVYEDGSPTGAGSFYGYTLEIWGAGLVAQNNLIQGGNQTTLACRGGVNTFCSGGQTAVGGSYTSATYNNNYFSGFDYWTGTANDTSKAISYEDGATASNAGLTVAPNIVMQISAAQPVAAPSVSPTSGAMSSAPTVTLASNSANHAVTLFYTTDGSTPAIFGPGGSAGTTQVYTGPFAAPGGSSATIKAIAHWGQGANQGIVFPQFGYVPSSVVTTTYTYAQAVAPSFSLASGTYVMPQTLRLSSSTPGAAMVWCFATTGTCTPGTPYTAAIYISPATTETVCALTTATGYVASATQCAYYVAVTLSSVSLAASGGTTITPVGATQLVATCHYSDSSSTNCTGVDSHGNSVTSYSDSTPAVATVSSAGLVQGVAVGTTTVAARVGSVTSSNVLITVANATPTLVSAALATTGGVTNLAIGATNQIVATCTYSDGSTTNCTTTDIHGARAGSWASNSASATINAMGLATGVGPGAASFSATVSQ